MYTMSPHTPHSLQPFFLDITTPIWQILCQ